MLHDKQIYWLWFWLFRKLSLQRNHTCSQAAERSLRLRASLTYECCTINKYHECEFDYSKTWVSTKPLLLPGCWEGPQGFLINFWRSCLSNSLSDLLFQTWSDWLLIHASADTVTCTTEEWLQLSATVCWMGKKKATDCLAVECCRGCVSTAVSAQLQSGILCRQLWSIGWLAFEIQ